jgi:hypothetical protein
MIVGIAGQYSTATEDQRDKNFDAMNTAVARVFEKGHFPFIGVNMALPIVAKGSMEDPYESVIKI